MKKRIITYLLVPFFFLTLHLLPACASGLVSENWPVPDHLPEFRVVEVIDGYTIKVEYFGLVKYHGLLHDKKAHILSPGFSELTGETVRIEKIYPSKTEDTITGYIFAGPVFINAYLIETGQTTTYLTPEDKYGGLFYLLQEMAKKNERGLWAPDASSLPAGDEENIIVYITKTGTRYHQAGCRYLSEETISLTLAEAVEQGYTPCRVCQPPGTVVEEE